MGDVANLLRRPLPRNQVRVVESGELSVGVDPSLVELLLPQAIGMIATAAPRSTHNMKLEIRRM
jgi:hypothetical protein